MAIFNRAAPLALALAGLLLAGCSGEGADGIFTGSLANNTQAPPVQEARIDPVCVSLVSRIETLRREGVGDKIEKAAAKRYKMTTGDLGKVDQLTKANAEFQAKCSTLGPRTVPANVPGAQAMGGKPLPLHRAGKEIQRTGLETE